MKKLLVLLSVVLMLVISLAIPAQMASAKVIRTPVMMSGIPTDPPVCENEWSAGETSHWRNCSITLNYSASDDRLNGSTTMVMSRTIFAPNIKTTTPGAFMYPAKGHGSWISNPTNFQDGYWEGTFTASVDSLGVMRVRMRGKGYGSLDGLFLSAHLEGNMTSTTYGVIKEVPTR